MRYLLIALVLALGVSYAADGERKFRYCRSKISGETITIEGHLKCPDGMVETTRNK